MHTLHTESRRPISCKLCNSNHFMMMCVKFRELSFPDRNKFIKDHNYCRNCLACSHTERDCKSITCIYCQRRHHSLLHYSNNSQTANNQRFSRKTVTSQVAIDEERPCTSQQAAKAANSTPKEDDKILSHFSSSRERTLLPTAIIPILHKGEITQIRALIDQGSQKTFITSRVQKLLGLPTTKTHYEILGMGGHTVQNSNKICSLTICSNDSKIKIATQAIILPQLTQFLPSFKITYLDIKRYASLPLADPSCFAPARIDMVVGSDILPKILVPGLKTDIGGSLIAQNTIFGWILSGPVAQSITSLSTQVIETMVDPLGDLLKKFWEQEEVSGAQTQTDEDTICEDLYRNTTYRRNDGRYVVKLPFKPEFPNSMALGHSRLSAQQQNISIERNLEKKPDLQKIYAEVLEDYQTLYHMERTNAQEIIRDGKYFSFYLPHHAVIKPDSKTTKV
ncbi:unnamed protein product [Ceratitis capitata]|uniref:(Mediterranean fruit fly) hypothetical protein n=1 Tax=Ceratitis capitata TaxID=7213 RepID=A0A811UV71_CERCA|nr:unnamed protein product [Ceratitis capitata]